MTIKLHIGAHKTATTHIQSLLSANKENLKQNNIKLSIPNNIRKTWLSKFLQYCRQNDPQIKSSLKEEYPISKIWILSEENFSGTPFELQKTQIIYPEIKKRLSSFKEIYPSIDIHLFFSIRSYDTYYRSNYLEIVRNRGYIPFNKFYDHKKFKQNNWESIINSFTKVVPQKNITMWRYEDLKQKLPTILRLMTEQENIEELIQTYKVETTRPSISKRTIEELETIHPPINQNDSKQIVNKLHLKYPVNEHNGVFEPFKKDQQLQLQNKYQEDILTIKKKYPNINFL